MIVRRAVDRNRVDRRPDRALDRKLLLGYFSLLILALLVAAFWATVILVDRTPSSLLVSRQ